MTEPSEVIEPEVVAEVPEEVIEEPETVEEEAARHGVIYEEGLCVYRAENGEETLGVCFFQPFPDGMRIVYIDAKEDVLIFDGLVRAAMSQLFDCKNDRVVFSDEIDSTFLHECRFITGNERRIESANKFFESCKKCKN